MIQIHRRQALSGLMALMAGFLPTGRSAQAAYPTRPIRVIVPFAAGGIGDTVMRVLAPTIEKKLGPEARHRIETGRLRQHRDAGSRARRV